MIKAIVFDFFGVLVTEGFRQFRETHFVDDKQKERQSISLINQVDSGLISTAEFSSRLAQLAGITIEEMHEQLGNNKPNRPLLDYIRSELLGKYKLGILSNSSENYPERLLEKEDIDMFDDVLLSYRYGIVKPQPEIYKMAAHRLRVSPSQALFIDDSLGHCQGAERAGMKAIAYQDFAQLKKDLENSLSLDSTSAND